MAGDPNLPRRVALDLMGDVMEHGRLLPEVLPRRLEKLAPEDRARTQRLVATAFRVMDRADRVLGPPLRKRPPLRIHNILIREACSRLYPVFAQPLRAQTITLSVCTRSQASSPR